MGKDYIDDIREHIGDKKMTALIQDWGYESVKKAATNVVNSWQGSNPTNPDGVEQELNKALLDLPTFLPQQQVEAPVDGHFTRLYVDRGTKKPKEL